jgi:titin
VPLNKAVKVLWNPPASHGATAISGYVVTPYKGGVAQTPQTFNSTATNEIITGLTNKTAYSFKVAAINAAGTGPQSATTGAIIAGAPGRPGKVKAAQGAVAGKIKVTFTNPMNNGAKITSYTAICKSSNGGALVTASRNVSPIGVPGATVGKKYTCQVLAKNSRGSGPRSAPSNAVIA